MTDGTSEDADHVVTAFLRHRGEIALLRRSDAVGSYRGYWGGVSGFAEGDPDEQVRREIREETGLEVDDVSVVRSGRPLEVVDDDLGRTWIVHPYLFDVDTRDLVLSDEHDAAAWAPPTVIVAGAVPNGDEATSDGDGAESWADRETVPALWTAYERVGPSVRSIAADDEHGAATLSIRALEVVRDRAGLLVSERESDTTAGEIPADGELPVDETTVGDEWAELSALADRVLEARPSMAVLRNRVNRAMADAIGTERAGETDGDGQDDPADDEKRDGTAGNSTGAVAVLESTIAGIERALEVDADAAANASELLGGRVLTLSRSGTVFEALGRGEPSRLFVAESRPDREGIDVAARLADDPAFECPITVVTDAAVAHVLEREGVDRVLVGADTILPDGSVVNKTGTRSTAIAAERAGVPVTVVAATDKVSTREAVNLESGPREQVYDGDANLDVMNPTFDVTPADCVADIVTERDTLAPDGIESLVGELAALESWRDG
ncbi:NUDIX domain-containing protein [Salinadaptatus halalkaliphilus]|uniref:NUDIX domain-containing protein n=1 Tax=Salinadaptatus halalkaliphilus TaxID=2419781 RepID=A0A4S3TNA5_9EURY|nr:NUDIX domain-containing protein [Salinadaptatus halalkaliphilus]THE64585.1 NUDIX domain-containing protein [Salinadaptatus halalkaliphilus]